jgi:hypothetical protein
VYPTSSFSTTVAAQIEVIAGGRTGNAKAIEIYGNVNVPVGSIVMLHRGYCAGYNGTWDSNQEYYFLYAAGITARKNNANPKYGPYSQIDFIEGDNIELTVANDTPNKEINVTIGVVADPTFDEVTIINNLYVTNIYVTFIEVTEINITEINIYGCTDLGNDGMIGHWISEQWRCVDGYLTCYPTQHNLQYSANGCVFMRKIPLPAFVGACCDEECKGDPPPDCCGDPPPEDPQNCCPDLSGSFCATLTRRSSTTGCACRNFPQKMMVRVTSQYPAINGDYMLATAVYQDDGSAYTCFLNYLVEGLTLGTPHYGLGIRLGGVSSGGVATDDGVLSFGGHIFPNGQVIGQIGYSFGGSLSYPSDPHNCTNINQPFSIMSSGYKYTYGSADYTSPFPVKLEFIPVFDTTPSTDPSDSETTSTCITYLDSVISGSIDLDGDTYTILIECIPGQFGPQGWRVTISGPGGFELVRTVDYGGCDPFFLSLTNIQIGDYVYDLEIYEDQFEICCDDSVSDPPPDPPVVSCDQIDHGCGQQGWFWNGTTWDANPLITCSCGTPSYPEFNGFTVGEHTMTWCCDNADCAGAVDLGGVTSITMDVNDGATWYDVDLTGASNVQITGNESGCDGVDIFVLRLYDSCGGTLLVEAAASQPPQPITGGPVTGTYKMRIYNNSAALSLDCNNVTVTFS